MAGGGGPGRPGVLAGGAPQTGTTSPKKAPLGGKRQDSKEFGRYRHGFSGGSRTKEAFIPGQKDS